MRPSNYLDCLVEIVLLAFDIFLHIQLFKVLDVQYIVLYPMRRNQVVSHISFIMFVKSFVKHLHQ